MPLQYNCPHTALAASAGGLPAAKSRNYSVGLVFPQSVPTSNVPFLVDERSCVGFKFEQREMDGKVFADQVSLSALG